jgi:hypothetical protein
MVFSGMLRRMALVRTDVSEELSASFIRVTRIGELGTTLAGTSNRRTLQKYQRRFLQEPHGITSQKTPFFTDLLFQLNVVIFYNIGLSLSTSKMLVNVFFSEIDVLSVRCSESSTKQTIFIIFTLNTGLDLQKYG